MSGKKTIGIYLEESVINDIDNTISRANCSSRNEFIRAAIRFYIAHLQRQDYRKITRQYVTWKVRQA